MAAFSLPIVLWRDSAKGPLWSPGLITEGGLEGLDGLLQRRAEPALFYVEEAAALNTNSFAIMCNCGNIMAHNSFKEPKAFFPLSPSYFLKAILLYSWTNKPCF